MSFNLKPYNHVVMREVVEVRELGKHVGYCNGKTVDGYDCNLMYAEKEIGKPCGRCGAIYEAKK